MDEAFHSAARSKVDRSDGLVPRDAAQPFRDLNPKRRSAPQFRTGSPTEVAILRACAEVGKGGQEPDLQGCPAQVAGGPGPTAKLKEKPGTWMTSVC